MDAVGSTCDRRRQQTAKMAKATSVAEAAVAVVRFAVDDGSQRHRLDVVGEE